MAEGHKHSFTQRPPRNGQMQMLMILMLPECTGVKPIISWQKVL